MTRLAALSLLISTATGCIFVDADGHHHDPGPTFVNSAPEVWDGLAACDYDRALAADILFFDAFVADANGLGDVMSVWADVYDEYDGTLVESFELYPTDDPDYWFSDWLAGTSSIDCWYPNYSVDLVAYDTFDDYGVRTVWLDSYR